MKILTFTTLFPNAERPEHGIFVENRLRHLRASQAAMAHVLAPVPWFPFKGDTFGRYAKFARVPRHELRFGTPIDHPRFLLIPGAGRLLAPATLYLSALRSGMAMLSAGREFDLIDAHFFYPDGVAAVMLGRALGKPVVITARGSDINLMTDFAVPRMMIRWAAAHAAGIVTVCAALKSRLVEIGIDQQRVTVLRNGVDLAFFRPVEDRAAVRARFGVAGTGKVLLSVGQLIDRKGHDLVIRALTAGLPSDTQLLIAGEGPKHRALSELAQQLDVGDRVTFLGHLSQNVLPALYSAADMLILASSREGWANVLLEAMACGTPVVASKVWGTPEVVTHPAAGVLVERRTPEAFASSIRALAAALPDRAATRAYAEHFSWHSTTQGQIELFRSILAENSQFTSGRRSEHHAAS